MGVLDLAVNMSRLSRGRPYLSQLPKKGRKDPKCVSKMVVRTYFPHTSIYVAPFQLFTLFLVVAKKTSPCTNINGSSQGMRPGDWMCPSCGNHNYAAPRSVGCHDGGSYSERATVRFYWKSLVIFWMVGLVMFSTFLCVFYIFFHHAESRLLQIGVHMGAY